MNFKCAHISDIHWRGLKRHNEYRQVFSKLFDSLREEKPDAIFIGGDIVHSKTQGISPELIDHLNWWFNSLASIAPTHVILGNHDGLILNKDRQDAITPIVNALNNPNINLYKKSGTYSTLHTANNKKINWCVFSCFDEENWSIVKPVKNEINIACFHGAVWGSKTDIDWELEGEVNLSFFDDYDFTFLGDIHKLQYLDKDKKIAYPGSTVQQNYGEDVIKGYLIWEINNTHDYSSRFISIENPHPFVTVEWKGSVENTLPYLEKVKSGARFRIKSFENISQFEIKLLHHYLKENKKAHEIVYQNLNKNSEVKQEISDKRVNIRSVKSRDDILKTFFGDSISEEKIEKVNKIFKEKLDQIPEFNDQQKQITWQINSLEFNNTFSYGKNNFINFNNLEGVVGLFGNNRAGKSSIPGTLMYCLYNSSDRGSLKNQDIVNIRKGECSAKAKLTIGTEKYEITRSTVKKSNKKGAISATTSLELNKVFDHSSFNNETEEQRRETDKIIKGLIGNAEDFLYTSFASQGAMNTFISEKSTARKNVLSKFLSLNIYEELYKASREEYVILKNKFKNAEEKNWDVLINQNKETISNKLEENASIANNIATLRQKDIELKIKINDIQKNIKTHSSGYNSYSLNKELQHFNENLNKLVESCEKIKTETNCNTQKLSKINAFKSSYSLEQLENDQDKLNNFLEKLNDFKRSKVFINEEIKRNNDSLKILDNVPCNEKYASCNFIKDAYNSKKENVKLNSDLVEINNSILEVSSVVKKLKDQDIRQKIKKYNEILNKEYKININLERDKEKLQQKVQKIEEIKEKIDYLKSIKKEVINFDEINKHESTSCIEEEIDDIRSKIYNLENTKSQNEKSIYYFENEILGLEKEKIEYYDIIDHWKTYDMFSLAVSKKGIPAMLINKSLPLINAEISKILSNVVNFKVTIEEEGNNLNVYIDYGDSKRIIECASGMEKMMSSIAIRVALSNISMLPKSNVFIIDEGFGALDDNNIEACSRLLKSLKKYFKTILIISHVDSIKDIVDKNIEISLNGSDSHVRFE